VRVFWISLLLASALAITWSFWPEGEMSQGSEEATFVASTEPPPRNPEIVSPADGAAIESIASDGTTPPAVVETEETPTSSAVAADAAATMAATGPSTIAVTELAVGLDVSIPEASVVPGSIVQGPKGVLLADDRFEIEGDGTLENPYRVSWELLVSAGESYRPRVGDRGIPQRIAMLDGKWVAIDGYVAFPMLVGTTSEALVMLNRWDGCCIGVPPSPYDAIEVKLDRPVVRTQMHAIDYGEVVGVLEVEPYLVDDWLVGLYLMDNATMKLDL
jgi:hypothetical protein